MPETRPPSRLPLDLLVFREIHYITSRINGFLGSQLWQHRQKDAHSLLQQSPDREQHVQNEYSVFNTQLLL
jgi:hypothetical protein